ncbi:MEKHLA domain-containing protein [Paenibacillus baekrokdamisoli]|uniref:MEKHLA domain-containing protein n=1 Tax=Paenibacillus baekrokdamisoli TaxID=1712516 RepID=A0A3G9ITK9_9BACL|nr:MEKHLA domain-containing protein [Paenibacillus baekrokdamisoli]MBB3070855.1 hypothetical protein [Paenibacillus baekrokdamisoli]BBH22207.1 MEKHLA domain-containing protein [Paenibacillus baekrokdamisoli]
MNHQQNNENRTSERHARIILGSYRRLLGKELFEIDTSQPLAQQLYEAPIVVLSHGVEADPVLNYGNLEALKLWEMSFEHFTQTESKHTAEPLIQAERQRFLQAVNEKGYIDDYSGIRISSSGRRFRIQQAIVWNLTDDHGVYYGQAAAFASYEEV